MGNRTIYKQLNVHVFHLYDLTFAKEETIDNSKQ